jgi:tagatose-6-phosphate ketose/aldose isomerase
MTSSFSNMVVFGQCLAHVETLDSYGNILHQLVEAGTNFRDLAAASAARLASENVTKACFVGSGALKAVATESALKLLELTAGKMQTMSESALGLRHGPMAALDEQTLLVAFLSGDEKVRSYEMDLLEEIGKKHLVKTRAVVSPAANWRLDGQAEHVLAHMPSLTIADDYRPPLDAMFGQLLGLFFSLRCGLKPDCPSPSGAISRVVQNVLIHS